jgi:hypothetical protein
MESRKAIVAHPVAAPSFETAANACVPLGVADWPAGLSLGLSSLLLLLPR